MPLAIYLDHAATAPLDERVLRAMEPCWREDFGNPASRHPLGTRAAEALDRARRQVARCIGSRSEQVVFTAGGTEANNLAVLGVARAEALSGRSRGHVLIGPTEHASVRAAARALSEEGFEVETARLDAAGALDLSDFESRLRPDTLLVAQMLVQNELGSVYPVAQLAARVRARAPRARLHVDAVQALGKLDVSFTDLGCDTLSLSAHKIGGPKGSGALVVAGDVRLRPLVFGGEQERGLRAGTQNVAGAAGLGVAAQLAEEEWASRSQHLWTLRERFVAGLRDQRGARVLEPRGAAGDRGRAGLAPSILAVHVSGAPAEVRMHHLEARGVYASAGSACQASKRDLNPTYAALGMTAEEARGVLRFSFAPTTTLDDVDGALAALRAVADEIDAPAPVPSRGPRASGRRGSP